MHPDNKYLPSPIWQESLGKLMLFLLKDIVVTLLLFIIHIAPIVIFILYVSKNNLDFWDAFPLFFFMVLVPLGIIFMVIEFFSLDFLIEENIYPIVRTKHLFYYIRISRYTSFISQLNDNTNLAVEKYKKISGRKSEWYTGDISSFIGKYIDKYYKDKHFEGYFPDYRDSKGRGKDIQSDIVRFKYMLKHKNEILSQQQQIIDKCIESAYIEMQKDSSGYGTPYRWTNIKIRYRQLHLNFHENVTVGLSCRFLKRIPQTIPIQWKDYFEQNKKNFSEFTNEVIDFRKDKDNEVYKILGIMLWWEKGIDELLSGLSKWSCSEISLVNFKTNLCFFQDKLKNIGLQQQPNLTWISKNENVNPLIIDHILIFEDATIEEISEYIFNKLHINDLPINHRVTIFVLFLKTTEVEMGMIIEKEYNTQKEKEKQRLLEEKRQKEEHERLQREKEEELRRKEEERRKKEEEIRLAQEEQKKFVARIHHAVSNWHDDRGFPYNAHIPYFPNKTLHTFIQQDAQQLVLNFKNGVPYIQKIYKEQLASLLKDTFKDDLAKLTFVCIPASNTKDNESRYKFFSSAICESTGMTNAYGHIRIMESAISRHLGGTSAQLIFDSDFFKGKYVVLFDDIITTGKTILNMKQELERFGADVICAISFGITTQDSHYSDEKLKPLLKEYEGKSIWQLLQSNSTIRS